MLEKIFLPYDIRGTYPDEINEDSAYRIGKAYAEYLKPKTVALGRDVRVSGPALWEACAKGLTEMGVDVIDLGIISTDMLYFAVGEYGYDGGMTITGSHNPAQYNGIKSVRKNAVPISLKSGLEDIKELAIKNEFKNAEVLGKITPKNILEEYVDKLFTFIDPEIVKSFKVVVNPNFGAAGPVVEKIAERLNLELVKLNFEQDGTFPKGRPDPLIPELRTETSELVISSGSEMGVAWDADADRIFWFDEKGRFVDGCYEGSVISKVLLSKNPGSKIVHDARLVWAAESTISENGGIPLQSKAGHTFIKEMMHDEGAIFGFENSAHMIFKDYYSCDNGMIPWILIMEEMSKTGKKLSEIVDPIRFRFPISEEVNFRVTDSEKVIKMIEEKFPDSNKEYVDGVSIEAGETRFNLRKANTGEPLVRLNVEAKTREALDPMKAEIISIIKEELKAL